MPKESIYQNVMIWCAGTLASMLTYFFILNTPAHYYNPDVFNRGMDYGVMLGYQVVIMAVYLIFFRDLSKVLLILAPWLSMILYYHGVVKDIGIFMHTFWSGPWEGIDAQDRIFDKQNIVTNLFFISLMVLLGMRLRPRYKSWDRSFILALGFGMTFVTIAYHSALYFTVWDNFVKNYTNRIEEIKGEYVLQMQNDDLRRKMACPQGVELVCFIFTDKDEFPEHRYFAGNPAFHDLKQTYKTQLATSENSVTVLDMSQLSTDDTYARMHVSTGFALLHKNTVVLFYWSLETPFFIIQANMMGYIMGSFLLVWIGGGLILSSFHRNRDVFKQEKMAS